jgi:hypothetical protein
LGVLGICGSDVLRVARIPEVFGNLYLLGCEYRVGERRGDDAHGCIFSLYVHRDF